MWVNPVNQYSDEISKVSSKRRELAKEETVGNAKNSYKWCGLAYISEGLKKFAPVEGLSISEQLYVKLPDASTLKIGTVPLHAKIRFGGVKYFLWCYGRHLYSDGIKQQAEALLRGEEYDPSEVSNSYFVRGLCEWFADSDTEEIAKFYESLVREYASHWKDDHTPDVNDLKTSVHL